jgi:hypothetical protein
MEILPGIATTWTRNPPEECDSGGNYYLIDEESTRARGFNRELPAYSQDQELQILYTDNANSVKNLTTKTSLKLKINLIRPY